MTYIGTKKYSLEVAFGNIKGISNYKKFGTNTDIDTGSAPEDLWGGSGLYTGFNATSGESISVVSSNNQDRGGLLTSGVSTGGSVVSIEDTGATFISSGVAVGDCIINDTDSFHGIVSAVTSETSLAVIRWTDGNYESEIMSSGKSYRIARAIANGVAVVKLNKMLETDYLEYKTEYIIMNGTTSVTTVGTDYIRNSRAVAIISGSNNTAFGVISANQTTTTANVFWSIPLGHDQTLVSADTIPKGKTLYVTYVNTYISRANGSAGSAEVDLFVRKIGQIFVSKLHEYITTSIPYNSGNDFIEEIHEYSDYKWNVRDVSDNNTQVSASVIGYLKDN